MPARLAADLVVAVHLAFVVFLLGGGYVAWRGPDVLKLHLPAAAVSAGLAITRTDCPLTNLEKWLRHLGGEAAYRGGFVHHYLVAPLHPARMASTIPVSLRVFTVATVAVAYLGLLLQHGRYEAREDPRVPVRSYTS